MALEMHHFIKKFTRTRPSQRHRFELFRFSNYVNIRPITFIFNETTTRLLKYSPVCLLAPPLPPVLNLVRIVAVPHHLKNSTQHTLIICYV